MPSPPRPLDGFAINVKNSNNEFKIIGESSAGNPFKGKVGKNETIQIFTGSFLPKGTNTVIIQENTKNLTPEIITNTVKFEKNHFQFLEYRFVGLFPLSLNSTKVSYQSSTVLKATASFSYDRYICGESSSLARALGLDLNNKSGSGSSGTGAYSYNDDTFLNQIITQNSLACLLYTSPSPRDS